MQSSRDKAGALAGAVAITGIAVLGGAEDAAAERISVTNTKGKGKGSFNRAVRIAERDEDKDKIVFAAKLSGSITTNGEEFEQAVALKSRSERLEIRGKGEDPSLRFQRENTLSNPGEPSSVRGLRLRDVRLVAESYVYLTVSDSTIVGDGRPSDDFPYDAGLYAQYGDLTVRRSTISGWQTGAAGTDAPLTIEDSTISGNERGISNYKADTQIVRSTVSGNEDIGVISGYYAGTSVKDSTISGNGGWALYGTVFISGSTITGNNGAVDGYYSTSFKNTIVADNPRSDGGSECTNAEPRSDGGNVFDATTDCASTATAKDAIVEDPRLGPLAANGGFTQTHALKPRSPAIGGAVPKTASATDQRGVPRDRKPDSGAFERALCGGVEVNVVGTANGNLLRGTSGADGIFAGAGPDRIRGGPGDDAICAGPGKDRLRGGPGDDQLIGEQGKDRCSGGSGFDRARSCKWERGIEG